MKNRDLILDGLVLSLGILGLFCLFSVSSIYYFTYQSVFFCISITLYFLTSIFFSKYLKVSIASLYFIIFISLIFLYLFGIATRGSVSWINLGFVNFQPSEFAKITCVFYTAYFLSQTDFLKRKLFKTFLANGPLLILIFVQPDFGNFFVLSFSILFTIFMGFLSFKKFLMLVVFSVALIILSYFFVLQGYQKQRINAFLFQSDNEKTSNYNLEQSKIAIGSGGLFGKGIKKNTQVILNFLPEPHTDFIFSAVSEVYGLIFALFLIMVFLSLIFWVFFKYIISAQNPFTLFFATGVLSIYTIQVVLNIGMTVGLLPITGLTLPFISYGGSSLMSLYMLFGILQGFNVQKNTNFV